MINPIFEKHIQIDINTPPELKAVALQELLRTFLNKHKIKIDSIKFKEQKDIYECDGYSFSALTLIVFGETECQ